MSFQQDIYTNCGGSRGAFGPANGRCYAKEESHDGLLQVNQVRLVKKKLLQEWPYCDSGSNYVDGGGVDR